MQMRHYITSWCVLLLLGVSSVTALTDEEVFRDLRFNLINPGARSLALGGAFISLADDATAAEANPSGLAFLQQAEYFAELRYVDNETVSSFGSESEPGIQTFVGTGTNLEDTTSVSFLSAVIPFRRWTLGLSRQELINTEATTLSSFGFVFDDSAGVFLADGQGSLDMEVTNFNASFGVRVTDYLGVGGTLTLSAFDARTEVSNSIIDTEGIVVKDPDTGLPMPVLEETLDLTTTIDDDDSDVIFSVGLIYKRPYRQGKANWSFGAVYRRGPDFTVTQSVSEEGLDVGGVRERLGTTFENRFHLPDRYGIGGSWGPTQRLTFSGDVERIEYSNLLDGYVAGVSILTSPDAVFDIDDGTDYRFGTEFLFLQKGPFLALALRAGASRESNSTIEAIDTGSGSFVPDAQAFAGGGAETHVAVGLGLTWGTGGRYKLDAAADFADTSNAYLISFIFRGK